MIYVLQKDFANKDNEISIARFHMIITIFYHPINILPEMQQSDQVSHGIFQLPIYRHLSR